MSWAGNMKAGFVILQIKTKKYENTYLSLLLLSLLLIQLSEHFPSYEIVASSRLSSVTWKHCLYLQFYDSRYFGRILPPKLSS